MESPNTSYYLLRWSDHISNYAEMFLTLREQEEFVDCSIACEDGIVGAHRLVLAGCSSYIRDLFKRSSNPHPIIFLLDVSRSTVLLLMEFIYRGQAHIPHSRLRQLVTLGKALKIKGLSQVFMPERCEPMHPQIPRLHGYPDPVCEVEDVFDNRPNGGTLLNNSGQGSFIATPLPSEKDFPATDSTRKAVNHKDKSDNSRKENHNMSGINNHIDEDVCSISDEFEDDSEESFEERLLEENSKSISEKVAVSQTSKSPEANYIPKPKSKQCIQEKLPKPGSQSKEKPLTPTSKQNIEKLPKPQNKKNFEDSPAKAKKRLGFDQSESPSKAKKKLKPYHSASPSKKNRENSESKEDRRASPRVNKKKNSQPHQKVKPPAYKIKKIPLQVQSKLYGRKQAKIELAAYALKYGFEASQRYASTKYGVKIRSKSLEKLVSMYSGLAKMKMKGLNNDYISSLKRPVGRPRKHPIMSEVALDRSGLDVDQLSSSITENKMVASVTEEENVPSKGSEFHQSGRKSLQFNVAGLFAKSSKPELTGAE
ncbi:protein jim lovell-like [Macrobrachium nipponense]|uniref:protein jim lovell-like n=1 Tax=Macrobrachium nipponense TaxID=159736 RepID=UPI0030C7CA63